MTWTQRKADDRRGITRRVRLDTEHGRCPKCRALVAVPFIPALSTERVFCPNGHRVNVGDLLLVTRPC